MKQTATEKILLKPTVRFRLREKVPSACRVLPKSAHAALIHQKQKRQRATGRRKERAIAEIETLKMLFADAEQRLIAEVTRSERTAMMKEDLHTQVFNLKEKLTENERTESIKSTERCLKFKRIVKENEALKKAARERACAAQELKKAVHEKACAMHGINKENDDLKSNVQELRKQLKEKETFIDEWVDDDMRDIKERRR